jgi:hypothetical protein
MPDKPKGGRRKRTPKHRKPEAVAPAAAATPVIPIRPIPIRPIPRPPIVFVIPTISSLVPTGVTVGSPAFTLTVNGSFFASDATVFWNGSARPTTFVSGGQLTAQIDATDVSTAGSANVEVTNSSTGMSSGTISFNVIPDINAILADLNQIAASINSAQMQTDLSNLSSYLNNQGLTISNLNTQISDLQNQVATLTTQNTNLNTQVATQQNTISQLEAKIAATGNQVALPVDVAQSFKNVMDQVHQQVKSTGGPQAALTNMQVQLKALVNIQQPANALAAGDPAPTAQAVLVFPDLTALPDPNTLSTLTFAFSTIPNLKAAVAPAGPPVIPPAPPGGGPAPGSG